MIKKRDKDSLAWSVATARNFSSTIQDKISAAEYLVAYGMSDDADRAIANAADLLQSTALGSSETVKTLLQRLLAVSSHFRQIRLQAKVQKLGPIALELLDPRRDTVLSAAKGARTLLVVFGTMYNDFWVSYPVLHALLPNRKVAILYLKDPSELMYLSGVPTFGSTFRALCSGIRKIANDLAIDDIRVTGFSSGGYSGLLAATEVGASSFLGFSVRTDLGPQSRLPKDRYVQGVAASGKVSSLLFDLRPRIVERQAPEFAALYYGALAKLDAAHAERLADLPNFSVRALPGLWHNIVMVLVAEGKFEHMMRRFVA